MSDSPHPITLQKVMFTRSVVIAVPGYEPREGAPPALPENALNLNKSPAQAGIRVATMKTILNHAQDKTWPYSIDMECVAVFAVDDSLSEADADRGTLITANSVCYGAIREAVAWITGRQPFGELILGLSVLKPPPPPVGFVHAEPLV